MNKKLLGIVLAIVLLIGGGTAFLLMQKDDDPKESTRTTNTADESNAEEESQPSPQTTTQKSGQYVDYTEQAVATTDGTKLLFFYAPWCPQCRALEADILDKGVPDGVTIFKVDYDTNQGLRQKYGVTIQTTVVEVDDQGNLIEKFVAYDEPTLASVKENLLQ